MNVSERLVIVYVRVSTRLQSELSQLPDLEAWVAAQRCEPYWVRDQFTGKTMERPGWNEVLELIRAGKVARIVVWRLDRLGRSAREMLALFEELQRRNVVLISLREGVDLSTPPGRLVAHVIASVAEYETELRAERVMAGQQAARSRGKRWGGSRPGRRYRVTAEKEEEILRMASGGRTVAQIARLIGLTRHTVYAVIKRRGLKPAVRYRRRARRPVA